MAKTYSIKTVFEVLDRAVRPLGKIGGAFDKLSKKVAKLGDRMQKIGKGMDRIGKTASTRLTLPLVALGTAATKLGFDFNESMANIATLIPGNIKRVGELKKGIQDLAVDVGKSTGDLADGLYQVISAFGDSSDSLKILETNAKAATAGLSTTADAINLTSAVTKAYGDTSAQAVSKAADLALLTVRLGQTTFPQLAASIGRVTPLAAQLNITQEEMFTGFATLTGVTGQAAEVSNQLAAILRAMLKPTEDMQKASKKLGFESASQMIKQKGLVESLKLLMEYTGGNEEATAKLFGRAEALTAVFALNSSLAEKYADNLDEMTKAEGALSDAFKEVTDGINKNGFTWKKFMSLLQVVGQEIGDILGPVLVEVVGHLREWLQMFRGLSPETKKFIVKMLAIVAAIGPVLLISGKFLTVLGGMAKILPGLPALLKATTKAGTPLALVFGKIALAITAIVLGVMAFNKASDKLSDLMVKSSKQTGWKKGLGAGLSSALRGVPIFGGALANISEQKAIRKLESGMQAGDKSQVDINLNLQAEAGTSATIDSVKRKGTNKNVNLNNISSFGSIFSTASGVFK